MNVLHTVLISLLFNVSLVGCGPQAKTEAVFLADVKQQGEAIATFAGGCFWCTEAVFERVEGVLDVYSGYTGGSEENPTYRQVSYGMTSHVEAIQVIYDPSVISYEKLLDIYFLSINPTQKNGQGPDIGDQYLSVIFYHDSKEKKAAEKKIESLNESGQFNQPVATTIQPFEKFWKAESYHQDYYELNPGNPYIINIAVPKVRKLKKKYPNLIKAKYADEN